MRYLAGNFHLEKFFCPFSLPALMHGLSHIFLSYVSDYIEPRPLVIFTTWVSLGVFSVNLVLAELHNENVDINDKLKFSPPISPLVMVVVELALS